MRMSAYLALGRALLLVSALRTHTYTLLLKTFSGSDEVTIDSYHASVILLYLLTKRLPRCPVHGHLSCFIFYISYRIEAYRHVSWSAPTLYTKAEYLLRKLSKKPQNSKAHRITKTPRTTDRIKFTESSHMQKEKDGTSLLSLPSCKVLITSSLLHLPVPCLWVTSSLPG